MKTEKINNNEKLPDIYATTKNKQNTKVITKQSIKQRNAIIDEYIKSLDNKGESKQNEISFNYESEKDPFFSANIKDLKYVKTTKNKLALPKFKKREYAKSKSLTNNENKRLKKKKNYSDGNIFRRIPKKVKLNDSAGTNTNINSKWKTSSNIYNNYINYSYHNDKNILGQNNLLNYRNIYDNLYNIRNNTAKLSKKPQNKKISNQRINSTLNTQKIIENKRQIYAKLLKEKNNPYGLDWITKIFKKNNIQKIELSKKQFNNGVPLIRLLGKKEMNKKELKKKLNEIKQKKKEEENELNKIAHEKAKLNEQDLDDEYNIPNEILEQFNQNKKNFFKIRKDIIEKPDEEDQIIDI